MLNTFMVYVENKPGVLTRVASLFRRRAFNIDSLTVGRTEKPEVSRMTITVDADRDQARRIEANLYKLVNVLLVENITNEPAIVRDLAMIKVAATHEARSHVLELASVFRARVVDVATESLTIEITGGKTRSTDCWKCCVRMEYWKWCAPASWRCGAAASRSSLPPPRKAARPAQPRMVFLTPSNVLLRPSYSVAFNPNSFVLRQR